MKKWIFLGSVVVFSLSFLAACGNGVPKSGDGKSSKCGKLYDKISSCVIEIMGDEVGDRPLGNKKDFVKGCKKEKNLNKAAKCLSMKDCKDFMACLEETKKQ